MAQSFRGMVSCAAVFLVLAACTEGPFPSPAPSPVVGLVASSPSRTTDPACRSPDRPALIGCEEAIRRAWEHGAPSPPSGVSARLGQGPGRNRALLWTVTFHEVEILLDGPRGGCLVGDWNVLIRAIDGAYLGGGTWDGPRSACPRIPAWSTPAPS